MSPIDQAFLKAFANKGRPSVVAAPASLPMGAARSADAPKPAAAATARVHDSEPAADPTSRLASKASSVVSSPRITLSEAIALRQAQQVAVESTLQWEADSQSTTYQSEVVEHCPLAVEPPTASLSPSMLAPAMPVTAAAATTIDTAPAGSVSIEGAPTTTFAVEPVLGDRPGASFDLGGSVTEATAVRLAQLTALWDTTIAECEAGVAKPLPTDAELDPAICRPADCNNGTDSETVSSEAAEQRVLCFVAGNKEALAAARPGVESQPIAADDATARIDQSQPSDSGIPLSNAEQHANREPCIACRSSAVSEAADCSAEHAAASDATTPASNPMAERPATASAAKAGTNDDAAEAAPILRLLRPAIQLERFAWPSLVSRWMRGCSEQLDGVVDALFRAVRNEQRIIGFSSCRPGEGVSSVVLATARRLSQRRCRFAVLEGNWDSPQLARRLALLANDGWETVIEGRRDLIDVMVGADEGRAAVVPTMRAPAGKIEPPRIAETYDLLRQNYEIILVDLPPRGCGTPCLGALCDSVVLVQHPRQTRSRELQQYAEHWLWEGIDVLGVVQNGLN